MAACGLAIAQGSEPTGDPLASLKQEHPRLILPDTGLERVRALIREYPEARKLLASLQREADKLRASPPVEYKLVNQRLLTQSRRVLERVYTFALLHRLDSDPAHLQGAIRELRAAALFPSWNPQHFIDVAEMTHAFAIGYDWLYGALAEPDRDWIRSALVEKGLDAALLAYKEQDDWVGQDTTLNLVCNSGVSIGALSVAHEEPERARRVLESALESIRAPLANYAPDGGWPEGPGFWNSGTRAFVCLLASLESALDLDADLARARGFERTGRFRVYFTSPIGRTFNFGDSTDDAAPAPEMFWLARRFNQPVYAWHEQMQVERLARIDPLDLIWFYKDAKRPQSDDWPTSALFTGVQTAFLRTAWDDPNAIYLAAKGGDNDNTHAHLDLGTFVLDAGGVRWAFDPEGDSSSGVHNVLMIDGESQNKKAQARITRHDFNPELCWVQIDLAGAYPGKVTQLQRRIGIAQKQAVIIQDILAAGQPVEPVWGLMTEAEVTSKGQIAELRKNDWILSCEIRSPHHAVFDVISKPSAKRLVIRLGAKVTELDLNVVLTPYRAGQPKPAINRQFPT